MRVSKQSRSRASRSNASRSSRSRTKRHASGSRLLRFLVSRKRKAARAKRKKSRARTIRRSSYGAGNHHPGMHGSEGRRDARFPLHEHAEQKEPAHTQPAGEKKV